MKVGTRVESNNNNHFCYICNREQELEYNEFVEEWECLDCYLRNKSGN